LSALRVSHPVTEGRDASAGGVLDAWHAGLRADGLVAHVDVLAHGSHGLGDVLAVGVAVDHDAVATATAEQLVEWHAGHLGLDVPQRHVDRGNRTHGHRAAPPVGAAIEVLPDILDATRIHANEAGGHVFLEIGHDGLLASVQGGIPDAVDTLVSHYLKSNEIAPWAGGNDAGGGDLHTCSSSSLYAEPEMRALTKVA
jgi:hypothetical protein